MKTSFNNQTVEVETNAFYQYLIDGKVVIGVASKDLTLFFPVFGVQNEDNISVVDGAMTIDPQSTDLKVEARTLNEVHNDFVSRLLTNQKNVGNKQLYWFFKKQLTRKTA